MPAIPELSVFGVFAQHFDRGLALRVGGLRLVERAEDRAGIVVMQKPDDSFPGALNGGGKVDGGGVRHREISVAEVALR